MHAAQPRPPRVAVALGALLLVAALGACGDEPAVVEPPLAVASVVVSAPDTTIAPGTAITAQAVVRDAAGRPLAGRSIVWSSTSEAVATVSPAGVITAVAPGLAHIAATAGGRRGELQLTVTEPPPPPPPPVAAVTLDATTLRLAAGATAPLVATARDSTGAPVAGATVAWTVAAPDVATVAPDGVVTGRRMGVTTIVARAGGQSAEARVVVTGHAPADLVFEQWDSGDGGAERPHLYRLDLRDPEAGPALLVDLPSSDPALSPDGTRLAFVCDAGAPAICVANADGGGVTVLPGFGSNALHGDQPTWSADGSHIAFRGWQPGGPPGPFNPPHVWVMRADGSEKVNVTADAPAGAWHGSPAWAPAPLGDARLAYARFSLLDGVGMVARIHSVRADGTDARAESAEGPYLDDAPTWSPDGGAIAFLRTGGAASGELWLANLAAGTERPLVAGNPAGARRAPAWSPDGERIAFASDHESIDGQVRWQIYSVRPDGTDLVRHTSSARDKGNPAWLPRR